MCWCINRAKFCLSLAAEQPWGLMWFQTLSIQCLLKTICFFLSCCSAVHLCWSLSVQTAWDRASFNSFGQLFVCWENNKRFTLWELDASKAFEKFNFKTNFKTCATYNSLWKWVLFIYFVYMFHQLYSYICPNRWSKKKVHWMNIDKDNWTNNKTKKCLSDSFHIPQQLVSLQITDGQVWAIVFVDGYKLEMRQSPLDMNSISFITIKRRLSSIF